MREIFEWRLCYSTHMNDSLLLVSTYYFCRFAVRITSQTNGNPKSYLTFNSVSWPFATWIIGWRKGYLRTSFLIRLIFAYEFTLFFPFNHCCLSSLQQTYSGFISFTFHQQIYLLELSWPIPQFWSYFLSSLGYTFNTIFFFIVSTQNASGYIGNIYNIIGVIMFALLLNKKKN